MAKAAMWTGILRSHPVLVTLAGVLAVLYGAVVLAGMGVFTFGRMSIFAAFGTGFVFTLAGDLLAIVLRRRIFAELLEDGLTGLLGASLREVGPSDARRVEEEARLATDLTVSLIRVFTRRVIVLSAVLVALAMHGIALVGAYVAVMLLALVPAFVFHWRIPDMHRRLLGYMGRFSEVQDDLLDAGLLASAAGAQGYVTERMHRAVDLLTSAVAGLSFLQTAGSSLMAVIVFGGAAFIARDFGEGLIGVAVGLSYSSMTGFLADMNAVRMMLDGRTFRLLPASSDRAVSRRRPVGEVALRNIGFAWDDIRVLDGVSFRVRTGEVVGITGPNGSGKSTLARIMTGLVMPDEGVVAVDGSPAVPLCGYCDQEGSVFHDSIEGNITLGRGPLYGEYPMGLPLPEDPRQRADELSRGQRKCVALLRALYGSPSLVVVDEPEAYLDGDTKRRAVELILSRKDRSMTVLFSHDPEILAACDRVYDLARPHTPME